MDNTILEQIKKELIQTLEHLTLESLDEHKKLTNKYFDLLEGLKVVEETKKNLLALYPVNYEKEKIDILTENNQIASKTEEFVKKDKNVFEMGKESSKHKLQTQVEVTQTKMYLFERKIRGGYVPEINGFVPEKVIRDLGLKHHDYVYAIEDGFANGEMKKYHYSLAKRAERFLDNNRVQVNFCPVEKDGNMLVVRKSLQDGRNIKFNEVPYTILLSEDDVIDFHLKEDMIIDIAYPADRPEIAKVVWSYDTRDNEPEVELVFKNKKSTYKKDEKIADENSIIIDEESLKGKRILIVGNEPKKSIYKESIEERGGEFLWADARSHITILEPLVNKSDMVIYLLKVSKHVAMKQIKALCKERDIPFLTTFSTGKTTIVKMAEETDV
ncbi:DUF2325 domain-containing protein [Bacillus sp. NPDC094106]|uniref:DUF2325 domain-containing protein n=1 Tax=Bacillus sp. NPDC094106 TaxID=3363949 RepID=UPI00381F1896